ncbi:MAG: class II glutamine amidotransferase [Conexivisphaerales archaeon]|jgi:glutamine amidotransferase
MLAILTAESLPQDIFVKFRRLSHEGHVPPRAAPGHVSGWGIYASDFGGSSLHYRSRKDAWDDPSFDLVTETMGNFAGPHSVMLHLRKASVGTPLAVNSHPFVIEGRAFMHNGSIRGLSKSFAASRQPVGQTDSEKLFLMLLEGLKEKGLPEALGGILPELERTDYSSLTFIMQDGTSLYAYRHFNRYEEYYTLYFAQTESSVIFASEPFIEGFDWHMIGNRELVRANYDGRRPEVRRAITVPTN